MGNKYVAPGVYVMREDMSVYQHTYLIKRYRKKKISNIFNFDYEDKIDDDPTISWRTNALPVRKTFTIPVSPINPPIEEELIGKYK